MKIVFSLAVFLTTKSRGKTAFVNCNIYFTYIHAYVYVCGVILIYNNLLYDTLVLINTSLLESFFLHILK